MNWLDTLADRFARAWRRHRAALLRLSKRLVILALIVGGLLLILWGARVSCELNPYCPWSHIWTKNR